MKLTKYTLNGFFEDGDGESGPHTSTWRISMHDTRVDAESALAGLSKEDSGAYILEEHISEQEYTAFKSEQEYIEREAAEYRAKCRAIFRYR